MKRILSILLVLVLMLGAFTSCDMLPFGNKNNTTEEPNIQEVVDQLDDMYEDLIGTALPNGYELVAGFKVGETTFTVTWTSNHECVKLELVDGLYVVTLSENNEGASEYKLTATITSPNGQKATAEYNFVLPQTIGMITNPVAGTAYKFALLHGNEKAVVYFNGENYNNYAWYLAYTTDVNAAVDVYLETVEGVDGGYRLYFHKDGVKTYIVAFPRDGDTTKGTLKFDTVVPDTYYTYSTEYNTLVYTSVTGEQFYLGSSGTYKSISCSAIENVSGATSYPARLYGPGGVEETLPEQTLPTIPENYTSQNVVDALYQLQPGQTIDKTYEITGKVTSIKEAYSAQYSNISVWIVVEGREDKPVLVYHAKDEGGLGIENIKVGDTITARGPLTNYNGTFETGNGTFITNIVPGTGEVTPPSGDNTPKYGDIVIGTAYKLTLEQKGLSKTLYFNGVVDAEGRMQTTTDLAAAAELGFEATEGGYHVYITVDGAKKYINTAPYINDKGYIKCRMALADTPNCVWVYDVSLGILESKATLEGETDTFFMGTYGTYETISLSGAYYKDQIDTTGSTQYPARLVLTDGTTPPVGDHTHNYVDGKCSCGATDPDNQPSGGDSGNTSGGMTVSEALNAAEGTSVVLTGTVSKIKDAWSTEFNNISVYLRDEAGNEILLYRMSTKVAVGDVITVTGTIGVYSNVNQVAQGATAVIVTAHTCEYADADCLKPSMCHCDKVLTGSVALGHTDPDADGCCTRCGANVVASYTSASLSFADKANRTTFTTSQQIWAQNGIVLTNDKDASTSNVADYGNPARFYKSSKITIEYAGMAKIDFVCNSAEYKTNLQNSLTGSGYTVIVNGNTVTVLFSEPVDSFELSLTGGQVRMNSLTVYAIAN